MPSPRTPSFPQPLRMQRVALLVPSEQIREVLVQVAEEGILEFADGGATPAGPAEAAAGKSGNPPHLSRTQPDRAALEAQGRRDLLAGEDQLQRISDEAITRDEVAGWIGWTTKDAVSQLQKRLAPAGAAVVRIPTPRGETPPTAVPTGFLDRSFAPLVRTYGTVPYKDIDPTILAGLAYIVMFGMMFADVGHGVVLVLLALFSRYASPRRFRWLAPLRPVWLFLLGAGIAGTVFGGVYGEFFGPTGALPVRWLDPLDRPIPLIVVAIGTGAVLLAGAYAIGTVNRWREGGWVSALYAPSGVAGAGLFFAVGVIAAAVYEDWSWLLLVGGLLAVLSLVLLFLGLLAASGGSGAGVVQASVELFDAVIRLGSNVVSFARLAAFGLTHAALGYVVWRATVALWQSGGPAYVAAAALFVIGNALTFGLEALVAGVQALRLEYYELFSRVFTSEGRPFRPWHLPVVDEGI